MQWLGSIHWFYLFQGNNFSKGCCLLTGRYRIFLMLTVLDNYTNMITSRWKFYISFKYTILGKGVIWYIYFQCWKGGNIFPVISSELGDHTFPNLLLCSSEISDEQYLSFLVCVYHHFILALLLVEPMNDNSFVL